MRIRSKTPDDWNFWKIIMQKEGYDEIVIENPDGDVGTVDFTDNNYWLSISTLATERVEFMLRPGCTSCFDE